LVKTLFWPAVGGPATMGTVASAAGGGGGGGDGQTAAGFWLHDQLDHRELADQVEAMRALLQSLRELVLRNVHVTQCVGSQSVGTYCDRLSQTVGKRRACERGEARSRSERKRERVRRHGGVMRWR
jgi:hypothetical protein